MRLPTLWIDNLFPKRYVKRLVSHLLPEMASVIPCAAEIASLDQWKVKQTNRSLSDMDVLWVGPLDSPFAVILHVPRSNSAVLSFERQKKILQELHGHGGLGEWHRVLPKLLYEGYFEGRPYWVEEQLLGVNANQLILDFDKRQVVLDTAMNTIIYLHQKTASEVIVGDSLINLWVQQPLQTIRNSNLVYYHCKSLSLLNKLEERLVESLQGRSLIVGWIHGDYWLMNILMTPDGRQVTGIVDWEASRVQDLPSLDFVNLIISTLREINGVELGRIIVETHNQGIWVPKMQELWEGATLQLNGKVPSIQDSLILFWLRHISANLLKSKRFSFNPIWAVNNYRYVLNYLESEAKA